MNPYATRQAICDGVPSTEERTPHGWRLWAHFEANRRKKKFGMFFIPFFDYDRKADMIQIYFGVY